MLFQGSHVDSDLISTKAHNSTYDLLYVHCQYPNDFYIFTAQSSFNTHIIPAHLSEAQSLYLK